MKSLPLQPLALGILWGAILYFLTRTVLHHQESLRQVDLSQQWGSLLGALGLTLAAHLWGGWVWGWILTLCGAVTNEATAQLPMSCLWSLRVYLQTNVAKYLPGNVWHFVGRVRAGQQHGIPVGVGILSVVLEAALMAVAALSLGILYRGQLLGAVLGLLWLLRPQLLNRLLRRVAGSKQRIFGAQRDPALAPGEISYPRLWAFPWGSLLGEGLFVLLRGMGFLVIVMGLTPLPVGQMPLVLGAFSLAWGAGLVVPGSPGGLGVFESGVIVLLAGAVPTGSLVAAAGVYRLISVVAELVGAGLTFIPLLPNQPAPKS
ncbi:MAG: UPF0104 family protein [Synechococcaceae cyanobacterium SM2_3_2]|nr:UPF0104 family protein [Synechococcaceae cyanobacterium SM2_3_2]